MDDSIKRNWARRISIGPYASSDAYAFWIEKSKRDPWTYDDLTRAWGMALALTLDGAGRPPGLLGRWAMEKAAGWHPRPVQYRPSDPHRDFLIYSTVEIMDTLGMGQREAFQWIGDKLRKSPKTIESAYRRHLVL